MPALTLKVFISSPGDVGQERVVAMHVLERIRGAFGGLVELEPILWEHEPLRATGHFQEQIPPPSEADIVVCILWSRLGTRLPAQFVREDGTPYASGTEWEFEDAVRAHRRTGKPDLLVYRKTAEPLAGLSDRQAILDRLEQKEALDRFIDRWFGNPYEAFRAAFHQIQSPDHFEDLLETHLTKLIHTRLPDHHVDDDGHHARRTWYDNPFRGLQAFDVEHAKVFAGRTRAIGEIKQALIRQAGRDCAFVVVFGMSGCGKSSAVRAGLLPTVTQPGVIEGIGLWRWGIFRPSDAAGDLLEGLAQAILGPQGLPELEAVGQDAGELAALLQEAPKRAVAPIKAALEKAAEKVAAQEKLPRAPAARLAVVVDQMEEIFTLDRVDAAQRERFIAALSALARSGHAWVIATMRSDFYPRCAELPELTAMKEGDGQYDLRPPTFAEIGQMIRHPTRAAGLHFEVNPESGERLDDVLHESAARDPEALPLLEFTLDELYKQRTPEDVLTFAAYEQLGGLEGALARRAEEVLSSLDRPAQEALPALLRASVTTGHVEDAATGRRVPRAELDGNPACRALVDAFIEARLLVTDRADDGQAVVGVAHEALLRHWPRVQKWLAEDQEFLRIRDRVADQAANWRKEGRRPDLLLPEGKPLADARDMLARRRADLRPELVEFVEQSASRATRGRRRRLHAIGGAAGVILALVSGWGVSNSNKLREIEKAREMTVDTLGDLTSVPQRLQRLSPQDSVEVLAAINAAIEGALRRAPDTPRMKRAKAVGQLLRAEMLRRQGDPDGALHAAQAAVDLGTQLVNEKGSPADQAKNERDLATFYLAKGRILGELSFSKMDDQSYQEALAAFDQCRRHAELAPRDPECQTAILASYFRTVELQYPALQGLPDTPEKQRALGEAVAMARKALELAKQRASRQPDDQTRSDVTVCEGLLRKIEGLQQSTTGRSG